MNKKLFFKFKYLQEEFKELHCDDEKYNQLFSQDFQEEIAYLHSHQDIQSKNVKNVNKNLPKNAPNTKEVQRCQKNKSPPIFKKIYKKLIKKIHPDRQIENIKKECEEKLKKITQFYKEEDWINLVMAAHEESIKLPYIPVEYTKTFTKQIEHLEKEIEKFTTKISWVWATTLKPQSQPKELLYPSLQIDIEKFKKWKNENS